MRLVKTFITALAAVFIAIPALAVVTSLSIRDLPARGHVVLSGEIQSITSPRSFTLRDQSGVVDIDVPASTSLVVKEGDRVVVKGKVERGLFGKSVEAQHIKVQERPVALPAPAALLGSTVATLPTEGWVKLSGQVEKISNEKEFILADATGTVPVTIAAAEHVALAKGARVTVIGQVDDGLLGVEKDIEATHVSVISDPKR